MYKMLKKLIPYNIKQKIKNSDFYLAKGARDLAIGIRRLDIASAQFAHILHLSGFKCLEGKVCIEVGAGWVLSHSLICYLLGAKKVIATDILASACPEVLSLAVSNAISSIPRDVLAPFADYRKIRERFDYLTSVDYFDFETLNKLGIEYKAPHNFATDSLAEKADFIYSFSVLEHVYKSDIRMLLGNLANTLSDNGAMIHSIHLEDHLDSEHSPFGFLSDDSEPYSKEAETKRGNRIRFSEWNSIFSNLQGVENTVIYKHSRNQNFLPNKISSHIRYTDKNDLVISHVGFYTKMKSHKND